MINVCLCNDERTTGTDSYLLIAGIIQFDMSTNASDYGLTLNCQLITFIASLIQWVECSTCNRVVGGSIPSTSIWVRVSIIPDVTNER